MSTLVGNVSAYQQLQNWQGSQRSINNQLFGTTGSAGSGIDYSSILGNATLNNYSGQAALAAHAALTRIQDQSNAKLGPHAAANSASHKLSAAQAATASNSFRFDQLRNMNNSLPYSPVSSALRPAGKCIGRGITRRSPPKCQRRRKKTNFVIGMRARETRS